MTAARLSDYSESLAAGLPLRSRATCSNLTVIVSYSLRFIPNRFILLHSFVRSMPRSLITNDVIAHISSNIHVKSQVERIFISIFAMFNFYPVFPCQPADCRIQFLVLQSGILLQFARFPFLLVRNYAPDYSGIQTDKFLIHNFPPFIYEMR